MITEAAGLGSEWVPRELRHTFVSLLSAHGVPVEAIALLAGHNQTATTELVYRHHIVPALTRQAAQPGRADRQMEHRRGGVPLGVGAGLEFTRYS